MEITSDTPVDLVVTRSIQPWCVCLCVSRSISNKSTVVAVGHFLLSWIHVPLHLEWPRSLEPARGFIAPLVCELSGMKQSFILFSVAKRQSLRDLIKSKQLAPRGSLARSPKNKTVLQTLDLCRVGKRQQIFEKLDFHKHNEVINLCCDRLNSLAETWIFAPQVTRTFFHFTLPLVTSDLLFVHVCHTWFMA